LTAYTTCNGGTGLYYVDLNVPSGNTTGSVADWVVEFDDTNDQNTGYEYSVRFGIYPVPASQHLNVEYFSEKANPANIEILSNDGKMLMSEKAALQEGLNTIQMNITDLSAGHYHIRMYNADDVQMQSFIKITP